MRTGITHIVYTAPWIALRQHNLILAAAQCQWLVIWQIGRVSRIHSKHSGADLVRITLAFDRSSVFRLVHLCSGGANGDDPCIASNLSIVSSVAHSLLGPRKRRRDSILSAGHRAASMFRHHRPASERGFEHAGRQHEYCVRVRT